MMTIIVMMMMMIVSPLFGRDENLSVTSHTCPVDWRYLFLLEFPKIYI